MKGKAVRENIDLAFDVYCAMGGIVEKALVESMLRDLLKQKKKYEQYFEGIQGVDNQASFAYANIIKTVIELSRKIKPRGEEKDPEELRRMADEILEMEYGIKRQ
jgi:phage shock protein A